MEAAAVAAGVAHRRVKRAMGLLRNAAAQLAAEVSDLDLIAEHRLERDDRLEDLLELIALARRNRGAIDVVILAAPRALED